MYDVSSAILARGAYSVVRKAVPKAQGMARGVACCVVKSACKRSMPVEFRVGFASEMVILKACDHPNIVRFYDSFEDRDELHIAMEMCAGGDMWAFVQDRRQLSEAESALVMKPVLQAVLYLHERKHIAHRDLKLENLLLKSSVEDLATNTVKVTDMGFARRFTPGIASFTLICGTKGCMAPEVESGLQPYDEKCDIWSCGVVLFEMLCGQVQSCSELPWTSKRLGGRGAKALLQTMCHKSPCKRASAREALQAEWWGVLEDRCRQTADDGTGGCEENAQSACASPKTESLTGAAKDTGLWGLLSRLRLLP